MGPQALERCWELKQGTSSLQGLQVIFPEYLQEKFVQIMENTLLGMSESWAASYKDFENSDEFKSFLKRLPSTHFLPINSVHLLWGSDWDLQARYRLLQSSLEIQRLKIQRTARKLFGLSIRCHHNPNHQMQRE
ncbi:unnamed protein product, partial [Lampetra planeri]